MSENEKLIEALTKPIAGIGARTAGEVFHIMADRIRFRLASPAPQSHVVGVTISAETVIAIRDALIANDVSEAYHQLYQAVDPTFCRYEPWVDTEAQLRPSAPAADVTHRFNPDDGRQFDTSRNVSEEEIEQWAALRADDAGFLARKLISERRKLVDREMFVHPTSAPAEQMLGSQENVARLLWERFSPDHEAEWPSTHAAEYRLAAEDILNLLNRDAARQKAAGLLRSSWSSFCDADAFPGSDTFADAMEAAGFLELVPVTKEALEDAFAAERGLEEGGMMYRLTDAGRAALASAEVEG